MNRVSGIRRGLTVCLLGLAWPALALADGRIEGRARFERIKGQPQAGWVELFEYDVFASPVQSPPIGHAVRTGMPPNMPPTLDGAYAFNVQPGVHSILFDHPRMLGRAQLIADITVQDQQTATVYIEPKLDYSTHTLDISHTTGNAGDWYQSFVATGTAITGIGFILAESRLIDLRVCILERDSASSIVDWPEVACRERLDVTGLVDQAMRFRTGEVPTTPGKQYAVRLAEISGAGPKLFKRDKDSKSYAAGRAFNASGAAQNFDLNLLLFTDQDYTRVTIATRTDGPGNTFVADLTLRAGQTFKAKGRALAGANVWVKGRDTWDLDFTWRVRKDGPTGDIIGHPKTTKALLENGLTALQGVSYNPDDVPLTKGQTYFIEFSSTGGFTPYAMPDDDYADGDAYIDNTLRFGRDWSMTLLEYAAPFIQTDFDDDGDVDADDLAHFQTCWTGPHTGPPTPECDSADLDGDDDVDQSDFGRFQRCLSGDQAPPPPDCSG